MKKKEALSAASKQIEKIGSYDSYLHNPHLCRADVVRAAPVLRVYAAALSIRPVRGLHEVLAATPPGVLARSRVLAALEVGTLGLGGAVGTAAVLLKERSSLRYFCRN